MTECPIKKKKKFQWIREQFILDHGRQHILEIKGQSAIPEFDFI